MAYDLLHESQDSELAYGGASMLVLTRRPGEDLLLFPNEDLDPDTTVAELFAEGAELDVARAELDAARAAPKRRILKSRLTVAA